jgi:hypothetical protein
MGTLRTAFALAAFAVGCGGQTNSLGGMSGLGTAGSASGATGAPSGASGPVPCVPTVCDRNSCRDNCGNICLPCEGSGSVSGAGIGSGAFEPSGNSSGGSGGASLDAATVLDSAAATDGPLSDSSDANASDSNTSDADASGTIFHAFDDAATEASTLTMGTDRTTGSACVRDGDCIGDGGPGVDRCSSDYQARVSNVAVQLWASPVCIVPLAAGGNCDLGTDPTAIHFCDGPDDPSSPGICVAFNQSAPVAGQGACLPKCTFTPDGSAATGCVGHDACSLISYVLDAINDAVEGIGACQSACRADADCTALGVNSHCEVDIGDCTEAPVARTKNFGDPCTAADETAGACFCATGAGTSGFCSSTCVVGAGSGGCPSGWVCDTGEPSILDFGAGAPTLGPLTRQTTGMLGLCVPSCTPGDASVCPGTSKCVASTIAGPDCEP